MEFNQKHVNIILVGVALLILFLVIYKLFLCKNNVENFEAIDHKAISQRKFPNDDKITKVPKRNINENKEELKMKKHTRSNYKKIDRSNLDNVIGVDDDYEGAPLLPKVDYQIGPFKRNDETYKIIGEPLDKNGIGSSAQGLEIYRKNKIDQCSITKNVFNELNKNGYLTNDQLPKTWNNLYKSNCGSW